MKNSLRAAGAIGLASLAFQAADAAVLNGRISKTADTCPTAIGAINGDDCTYNDSFAQPGPDPWVGPGRSSGFYASSLANGVWTTEPSAGDGKVSPNLTANITIGGGNVVSGTIVIGPVAINNFSAGPGGRGEDSWTSATITLAAKAADSVVGNTLIIGSAGYPPYIVAANSSDHFPSETGADSNADPTPDLPWWAGPSPIGITVSEGNIGTTGSMPLAAVVGWTCNDVNGNPADGACSTTSSFRGRGDFENILLKITTDGLGNPIAVEGFLVQGVVITAPNWVAWTFKASADTDVDGVPNHLDNCQLNANGTVGPAYQLDANGEGYGNICDADINNSGTVTATDFNLLRSVLNQSAGANATAAASDMNGSGTVTATDFNLLRARLNQAIAGQSGLPCAGTAGCNASVQQP